LEFWLLAGLFVGEHDSPEVLGDPAFAAPYGLAGGLGLAELAAEVVVAGAAWGSDLDQGDEVQGVVELPVTGVRQPMSGVLSAGDLERRRAGVAGEMGRGGDARGPSGAAKQPTGDDRPDTDGLGQTAAECRDGVVEPLADHGQPSIQSADLGDQVPGDPSLVTGVRANGPALAIAQASFPSLAAVSVAIVTFAMFSVLLPVSSAIVASRTVLTDTPSTTV
jgi:hypothetical protein